MYGKGRCGSACSFVGRRCAMSGGKDIIRKGLCQWQVVGKHRQSVCSRSRDRCWATNGAPFHSRRTWHELAKLACIDSIAQEGICRGAYPGCQIVVWKDGKEMYNKAFGTHGRMNRNGTAEIPVKPTNVYDIASLTKTTATLLAVMKLYDEGKLNLTDRIGDILPFLKNTDKRNITIRELLLHESGLPSTLLFYGEAIDKDSYRGGLYKQKPDKLHSVRIGASTWANPNFRFKKGLVSKVRTSSHVWQVSDSLWLDKSFKQIYLQKIADAPLRDKRYRYSCVGFIVLQQVVETLSGLPLDAYLEKVFYAPMGLTHTAYLPLRRLPKEEIVPSSSDPFLRKRFFADMCTMSRLLFREEYRAMPDCFRMPVRW